MDNGYTMKAIPTEYRGAHFRSRLEARWAAFFDIIGWDWVYEPFDADGWVPDFLITGSLPLLVEVGPCSSEPEYERKGYKALSYPKPTIVFGVSPEYVSPRVVGGLPQTYYAGWLMNESPNVRGPAHW